jgi:tetratricopeptide (TPR) repeat protein
MIRLSLNVFPCLIMAVLFLTGCQPNAGDTNSVRLAGMQSVEIPSLHTRAEKLMYGKEWDNVQNFYGTNAAALRENSSDWDARLNLAELFIQEARVTGEHPYYYPAALKMLEPLIAAKPENKDIMFRALSHKASIMLSLHAFDKALQTAEQAVAINPYNSYIYGCLVDANVELGRYAKAVEYCDKMVSIRPDLRSYSRVSYLREIHGDIPGAIAAMEMAVKAGYPGFEQTEWARMQLGHLKEQTGNIKDAEKIYQTCITAREDYPFAIAALGKLEYKKGNFKQAEDLFKQAIGIIPEIGFNIELAKLYQQTGRKEEAATLKAEIKTMFAEDIAAGHNMSLEAGHFYLELMNDTGKALEFAREEYRMRPDNIDVNALLAAIYAQTGDKAKAKEHLTKALAINAAKPDMKVLKRQLAS